MSMPCVSDVDSLGALLQWSLWSLAILTLANAIFRSFLAMELAQRFHWKNREKQQRIRVLQWEVAHRQVFTREVQNRSPHAAAVRLTEEQVAEREEELREIGRAGLLKRMWYYFRSCLMCQAFWIALFALIAFSKTREPAMIVASALAYSATVVAAKLLYEGRGRSGRSDSPPPPGREPCAGCGR